MRRTSGVNPILFPAHPQAYPVGQLDLDRPRTRRHTRRFYLHNLPLAPLSTPLPAIPLFKRSQRHPLRLTKLPTPHSTLAIPRTKFAPLRGAPLDLPIRCDLPTFLLYQKDGAHQMVASLFSRFSALEGRTPLNHRLR